MGPQQLEAPQQQEAQQQQEGQQPQEDPQQLVVQHLLGVPPLLGDLQPLVAQPLLVVPHLLVDLPQQVVLQQQEPQQLPLQLEQPPPICREEDKLWNESSFAWKLFYHHISSDNIQIDQYIFLNPIY